MQITCKRLHMHEEGGEEKLTKAVCQPSMVSSKAAHAGVLIPVPSTVLNCPLSGQLQTVFMGEYC